MTTAKIGVNMTGNRTFTPVVNTTDSTTTSDVSMLKDITVKDIELDVQIALNDLDNVTSQIPTRAEFERWIKAVLFRCQCQEKPQITIRIVELEEMMELNSHYRHKQGATNVLSFPFESPQQVALPLLGDIVACLAVISQEAEQQGKSLSNHWAHMVVHSVLHLVGYDHIENDDAIEMEALEISILSDLGVPDPYGEIEN